MIKFTVCCKTCPPPNNVLFEAKNTAGVDEDTFRDAWAAAAPNYTNVECGACGSKHTLDDAEWSG